MERATEYSIFLHIIEGTGFNEKNDEISLTATLNGVKFDVEGHNTEFTTIFNTNCIWECMFDDLKRMKTDNRPIKIEGFHKTQKNGKLRKKTIGFVLLPIRALQTVKSLRNLQIKLHWYKLCGLGAEWRVSKPEIYLSAIIITKELMEGGQLEEFLDPKPNEGSDSIYVRPSDTSLMLRSQFGIFVKLLEDECLLQVGKGPSDCEKFIVTITLRNIKHLSHVATSTYNEAAVFRLHYDFLGGPSDIVLEPNSDSIYSIHEKISVNFKSSLESLRDYFRKVFYIPLELYYNDNLIATYKFRCAELLPPSMEIFNNDDLWELKDTFPLQTLTDVFNSPIPPSVEYLFVMNYVPNISATKSSDLQSQRFIDKKARGDMGDADNIFELPPTIETNRDNDNDNDDVPATHSATHRIDIVKDSSARQTKSEPMVTFKQQDEDTSTDDIAYRVIDELEDWKCQQMEDFLAELKQREEFHLDQLSIEWDRQKGEMLQRLQESLDECSRLTDSLEAAQLAVNEKGSRQEEEERALENAKHELDKRYLIKFMEIEEQARRIKDEMDYELRMQDLHIKELQMEKDREEKENERLRERVTQLEEEIEDMRKNFLPREQLAGLFEDLRQQSERYEKMEESKRFYKEQWGKLAKEIHRMKLQSLKAQEENLKRSSSLSIDNVMFLRHMIFNEQEALLTERGELQSVRDALTSESDDSKSSCGS